MPAALLVLQAIAHDTVVVRPLPPVRTAWEQFFFVTSGLTSVLLLVLLLTLIAMAIWARRAAERAGARLDALLDDLRPMVERATAVSESVRSVAETIQRDVTSVHEGVQETSQRVKRSVGELADRMDDFNDLLGKVHARADTMVDVAGSAIDGISWGVKKLRGRRRSARKLKGT